MAIQGIFTAMVTPIDRNNQLDMNAWRLMLREQVAAGVAGVVPCGTTGENPALTDDERKLLIEAALEETEGHATRVFAGTGTNHTAGTVTFSKWASTAGVAGILVVTPYYSKPSQAGLEGHFRAVADQVDCEVLLYNVPGRTGVCLAPETVVRLADHPNITGLKEATGDIAFTSEILDQLAQAGRHLDILSGDDATFLPLMSIGAVGAVSVASNVVPRAMVAIFEAATRGDLKSAQALHHRFYPLFRDLFVESNPVPVKYALAHLGWCYPLVRQPLAELSESARLRLSETLAFCRVEKGRAL